MKFFSQCEEDKIIYEKYLSKLKIENGTYLEMGAHNGITYSNTYFLEKELGWKGILVEPNKISFEKLKKNRPDNVLFNELVSNESIQEYWFFTNSLEAVSGIKKDMSTSLISSYYDISRPNISDWSKQIIENNLFKEEMKTISLGDLLKKSGFLKIDFFSLDVEGHEYGILLSNDWTIPINMILVENNPKSEKIKDLLVEKNYIFLEKIAHNTFWCLKSFANLNHIDFVAQR